MTIRIISVGVSILDPFRKPHRQLSRSHQPDVEILDRDVPASRKMLSRWFEEQPVGSSAQEALDEAVKQRQPKVNWTPEISAEWSTFEADTHQHTLPRSDVAYLTASDTREGLAAALWNAIALAGEDLQRLRYFDNPNDNPESFVASVQRGSVVIVRVPELDTANRGGPAVAMGTLGCLGRALRPQREKAPEPVMFYLSGGYKCTLPYLIGTAEGMKSLPEFKGEITACVLHESSKELIPLPLRRLNPCWVRKELERFYPGGETTTPPEEGNVLEGYAYKADGPGRWKLTAFGHGLLTVFGISHDAMLGR